MVENLVLAYNLQQAFRRYSANKAIRIGSGTWTYGELNSEAVAIARAIIGAAKDNVSPVAILGARSFTTYAGICGALFASGSYMPLNLKFPASRNAKMLELSGATIIIADENAEGMLSQLLAGDGGPYHVILKSATLKWADEYPAHHFYTISSDTELPLPDLKTGREEMAYLLFTSGTTGVPKGVPVSNRNVMAYLDHIRSNYDFREKDRFSQTFDLTFDLSVHDMMVCWLSGACLCIPEDDSPFRLASYIREAKISVWFSVPSAAVLMNKMRLLSKSAFKGLRLSFFCGEPLPENIAARWAEATGIPELINLYGPTEATIAISACHWMAGHEKSLNGIVSIGKVFEGQEYLLLDAETMHPAENKGELCLAGSQVVDGYLDAGTPEAGNFITLEQTGEKRWYRTGDLVQKDEEGDLFFIGRTDTEVKISGFRVNLFEVDAVVRRAASTDLVACVLDDSRTPCIVAFVGNEALAGESKIIKACKKELPWYMIPERIIFVDEMPLNVNAKIDRNRLKQSLHE